MVAFNKVPSVLALNCNIYSRIVSLYLLSRVRNVAGLTRMTVSLFRWSLNRWFYIFCCMGLTSMTWMAYKLNSSVSNTRYDTLNTKLRPLVLQTKEMESQLTDKQSPIDVPKSRSQRTVESRALLILNPSRRLSTITIAFLYSRWRYNYVHYKGHGIPSLVSSDSRRLYSVIVFEDLRLYLTMDSDDRDELKEYCKQFKVGIIFFTDPTTVVDTQIYELPLTVGAYKSSLVSYVVNDTDLADIAKPSIPHDMKNIRGWAVFHSTHPTYRTICYGTKEAMTDASVSLAILDTGQLDGIVKVLFGHKHSLWIHKILFLDALSFLTKGAMKMDKTKLIQIDIDDMFLGSNGTKMKPADVKVCTLQLCCRSLYHNFYAFFCLVFIYFKNIKKIMIL